MNYFFRISLCFLLFSSDHKVKCRIWCHLWIFDFIKFKINISERNFTSNWTISQMSFININEFFKNCELIFTIYSCSTEEHNTISFIIKYFRFKVFTYKFSVNKIHIFSMNISLLINYLRTFFFYHSWGSNLTS